ncbi:MAG: hypothetical protein H0T51_15435, partial [Pirellulales bacterium]|nr:hypothetical protein [Pirellulales bacterium]
MPIVERPFDSEAELEQWAFANLEQFFGKCLVLGKFQITTPAGKVSLPDGLAFNLLTREWYVLEAELLKHGVWPHIAEQVTRFVVSLQSQDTLRKIRDRLFEHVLESGKQQEFAEILGVDIGRVMQQVELFVE